MSCIWHLHPLSSTGKTDTLGKVHIEYRLCETRTFGAQHRSCRPLSNAQCKVINCWSIDISTRPNWIISDWWVYELTTIGLILSCACMPPLQIGTIHIRKSGGHTNPSRFQFEYWYLAAMSIQHAAVPLNGGWISFNCTISLGQL